jgi:hypothetical protein
MIKLVKIGGQSGNNNTQSRAASRATSPRIIEKTQVNMWEYICLFFVEGLLSEKKQLQNGLSSVSEEVFKTTVGGEKRFI